MVQGVPEGYELIRLGYPEHGELFAVSSLLTATFDRDRDEVPVYPVAILRKIENNWKRLTLGMWDGVPRPARFRLTRHEPWQYGIVQDHRPFAGWRSSDGLWYKHCEVQDGKEQNG
jgi:hypothetical protein